MLESVLAVIKTVVENHIGYLLEKDVMTPYTTSLSSHGNFNNYLGLPLFFFSEMSGSKGCDAWPEYSNYLADFPSSFIELN